MSALFLTCVASHNLEMIQHPVAIPCRTKEGSTILVVHVAFKNSIQAAIAQPLRNTWYVQTSYMPIGPKLFCKRNRVSCMVYFRTMESKLEIEFRRLSLVLPMLALLPDRDRAKS